MILLIQELQEKYDLLDENLNSIMILLILDKDLWDIRYSPFKFHYDSINSNTLQNVWVFQVNLNSIMILLIL